jgi:transcriptional regulator with XRE-family HTH domain
MAQARAKKRLAPRARAAELGEALGQIRRAAGLTQTEVAKEIGTKRTDLSRLESGRYGGLTIERVIAILGAIGSASGMDVAALVGRIQTIGPPVQGPFFGEGIRTPRDSVEVGGP